MRSIVKSFPVLFLLFASLLYLVPAASAQKKSAVIKTEVANLVLDTIAKGITIPFGMEFLPDGKMLVSDRSDGKIWLVNPVTKTKTALKNVP
jgi:glucose/arabinose dehydrogenase